MLLSKEKEYENQSICGYNNTHLCIIIYYFVVDELHEKLKSKNEMIKKMHLEIEYTRHTSGNDEQKNLCAICNI